MNFRTLQPNGRYLADVSKAVGDTRQFIQHLSRAALGGPVLAGFDCPIGRIAVHRGIKNAMTPYDKRIPENAAQEGTETHLVRTAHAAGDRRTFGLEHARPQAAVCLGLTSRCPPLGKARAPPERPLSA